MSTEITRRNFARVALAATAGLSVAANGDDKKAPPVTADKPADAKRDAEETRREDIADQLTETVRIRFPSPRLLVGTLGVIHRDIADYLRHAEELRKIPLGNADEPAYVFAAYRADDIR